MKALFSCLILFILFQPSQAQSGRGDIRQGNRYFKSEKFDQAEVAYRKALEGKKVNQVAGFNLGDALYKQKKYEEAGNQFQSAASSVISKNESAKAYHNLGNSYLQDGKIDESIVAYKDALRKNPTDLSTKYNLSYAQMMKKKQEQQKQEQKNDKNDQNKDQKDQQNKDQQQNQDEKKDQNKDQQQQQNKQDQQDQKSDPKQADSKNAKMSKEDAKRLLEALATDEKKVQDKVKKEKANATKVRTLKDW